MNQMLAIGDLVLSVYQDSEYEKLVRTSHGGFVTLDRGGQSPASQQVGPALDTIQITGTLLGGTGGEVLARWRELQAERKPQPVVRGSGEVLGLWMIQKIVETESRLIDNGVALKTQYSVDLEQYR
ncbi:phage tail protein [Marinobacterium jannaschii]|uniref:phage tail protein n=1 Tax=Marinobacterium jannaschii TaxID=64970 RepID=UPI0004895A0A|nr:phage tail protein [Marinobacterium jannaschii]